MPVITTLPPTVNNYNTGLRSAIDQRFGTVTIDGDTTVPDPGSPSQFVVEAVSTFSAQVDSLDTRVTSLEVTRAPKSSPTLTNTTLNLDVTANGAVGTAGQFLTSAGNGANVYWSSVVIPATPSLNDVVAVSGSTTRAISVSNTFAAGNTTITGFANVTSSMQVGSTLAAGNTTITGFANVSSTLDVVGHTRIGPYAGSAASGNITGLELINNGGTGDNNVAAMSFHCSGYYGTHLHLRHDGYFGAGGWSASTWRWYVNMNNGDMTAAGAVTSYSDPRLKEDITPIKSALDVVRGWNGVKFRWKQTSVIGNPGKEDYGVLSPDIQKTAPELVKDSVWDSPDGDKYKTVDYPKIAPFLIEAIKEQQQTIDEQRVLIEKLQQQVDQLASLMK